MAPVFAESQTKSHSISAVTSYMLIMVYLL